MQIVDNIDFKLQALNCEPDPDKVNFVSVKGRLFNPTLTERRLKHIQSKTNRRRSQDLEIRELVEKDTQDLDMSEALEADRKYLHGIINEKEVKLGHIDAPTPREYVNVVSLMDEKSETINSMKDDQVKISQLISGQPQNRASIKSSKAASKLNHGNKSKKVSDVVATYANLPPKFRRRYEEMLLIPRGN